MSKNTGPSIETSFARFAQNLPALEYWVDNSYVPPEPPTKYDDGYEVGHVYMNGVLMGSGGTGQGFGMGGARRSPYDIQTQLQSVLQDALRVAREREGVHGDLTMTNLTLVRMEPNVSGQGLDLHIRFKLNGEELWGVFRRYGVDRLPVFTSELHDKVRDRVANTKLVGVLRKTMETWLTPKAGRYKCLANAVRVISNSGELYEIHRGTVVEVLRAVPDKLRCELSVLGRQYSLSGENYLRFNYWFERK